MSAEIDIDNKRVALVGAGSWGTALAHLLADKGFKLDLWAYETEVRDQIVEFRENKMYLPGFELSEKFGLPLLLRITTRLSHSRTGIARREKKAQNQIKLPEDPRQFVLLPSIARKNVSVFLYVCSPANYLF